ncbi:MAG: LUD domain-containing protein [Acidobacteria bacterium]|nr:LUD domain-containing protein [Acidobacteriota bacterium]
MARIENTSRERILERVRTALKAPTPYHPATLAGPIFSEVTDPVARFQAECTANLMECILARDEADSAAEITKVLQSLPAGDIFIQDAPQFRRMAAGWTDRNIQWSSAGRPAEQTYASITACEAFVAMSGSILISSGCGGRAGSVSTECHIVHGTLNQLLPDLEAAMAHIYKAGLFEKHSYVGLITGSSRTADIEKILVMGAHGPRRLVVIVQTG